MSVKKVNDVIEQINKIILGKEKIVREVMLAFLANGHVLLEDIPGLGRQRWHLLFRNLWIFSTRGYSLLRMFFHLI